MKKTPMYIFFDDVAREYRNYYGTNGEKVMIKDLKNYLTDFSKTSEIKILTRQDVSKIKDWFLDNNLYGFVENIANPEL
jgi:hypothetical protein